MTKFSETVEDLFRIRREELDRAVRERRFKKLYLAADVVPALLGRGLTLRVVEGGVPRQHQTIDAQFDYVRGRLEFTIASPEYDQVLVGDDIPMVDDPVVEEEWEETT